MDSESVFTFAFKLNRLSLTQQDFDRLAAGDEQALQAYYKTHYSYVTGWLLHREQCPADRVGALYTDAVLRVRDAVLRGRVEAGNLRAYLLKTAINGWKMERRSESSLLKRYEQYLQQLPDEPAENDFDQLVRSEEETGLEQRQQRHILAVQQALAKLSDACRQLLLDTIVNGIKVGGLATKFGLKDARGVTAKKQDCKNQLQKLTLQFISKG